MEILEANDLSDFDALYNRHFIEQFPIPGSRNIPVARVVKDKDGKVVASGFLKLFTEAIIVTDQARGRLDRVKALDLLVSSMIDWGKEHSVEQVHAFVNGKFGRVLVNRYGFEHTKQVSLVLDLEGGR